PRKGVRAHRATTLDERNLRRRHGLPVTSPARTVIDISSVTAYAGSDQLPAGYRSLLPIPEACAHRRDPLPNRVNVTSAVRSAAIGTFARPSRANVTSARAPHAVVTFARLGRGHHPRIAHEPRQSLDSSPFPSEVFAEPERHVAKPLQNGTRGPGRAAASVSHASRRDRGPGRSPRPAAPPGTLRSS